MVIDLFFLGYNMLIVGLMYVGLGVCVMVMFKFGFCVSGNYD